MNAVFETEPFSRLYNTLERKEQEWIEKVRDQLSNNLKVGKPLRYDWFREKKFENKRLYYLINEKTNKAILIAFGIKKEQKKIIDHIISKENFAKFVF